MPHRIEPNDSHLQPSSRPLMQVFGLPPVMMVEIRGWLPLWLPLIGSTLVLHSAQRLAPRLLPPPTAVRPGS